MSLYEVVAAVKDPELPVITIGELGVLRDVSEVDGHITVTITPTYSGCPAMDAIREDIRGALAKAGHDDVSVVTELSPAWSTDMISESGRKALARAGIAPPPARHDRATGARGTVAMAERNRHAHDPACPHCASRNVLQISRYASTPCQSLWKCHGCAEPFNAVKPL